MLKGPHVQAYCYNISKEGNPTIHSEMKPIQLQLMKLINWMSSVWLIELMIVEWLISEMDWIASFFKTKRQLINPGKSFINLEIQ